MTRSPDGVVRDAPYDGRALLGLGAPSLWTFGHFQPVDDEGIPEGPKLLVVAIAHASGEAVLGLPLGQSKAIVEKMAAKIAEIEAGSLVVAAAGDVPPAPPR